MARDLPGTALRTIADGILNLIYPESCFICSDPLSRMQECGVCRRCWENTLRTQISPPLCPSCGIPFQSTAVEPGHLCGECGVRIPPYSGARSFGYYRAELGCLIRGFKFEGRRNLSALLSPLLACTFVDAWDRSDVDLVIPVPLHPRRRRERGFNQAAVLSRDLSRLVAIPCCENALVRARDTVPQIGLSDSERLRNVRQALRCRRPDVVSQKRLLLVDDVMTTGATVCSASEALLDAGALRVSVLTVARAVPGLE